ncbi:Autoinducer 2 sensor kinase/phosphatase LuxQ [Fundidesulfovibrio magnetotacticus]|uniref:histidine kinase n=1 Tax=Fundidesulfovibrio magnetotacticus TaxID=2730080 RepID=A0A6V8LTH2_9BACT|nr:ATP-binding protein [Fundidesulfovibrio magnetotacticus]GFK95763.1 Autoinducer 2 sensor kinase/phosphatase LuxQ [Fundidesulfovibrio magnetotacticus]
MRNAPFDEVSARAIPDRDVHHPPLRLIQRRVRAGAPPLPVPLTLPVLALLTLLAALAWPERVGLAANSPPRDEPAPTAWEVELLAAGYQGMALGGLILALAAFGLGALQGRRKAVAEAVHEQARFEAVFRCAGAGIALADTQARYLSVNPAFTSMLGYDSEDLRGRPWDALAPPDASPARARMLAELLEGKREAYSLRSRLVGKDGGTVWADLTVTCVRGPDARASLVIAMLRDATLEVRLEESLRASTKAAQAASQAKSSFLANMSHEIRTPTSGMLGMLNLLRDSPLDAEQRKLLDMAAESGVNLLRVLNEILDLSRIEAGYMVLCAESVDSRGLLANLQAVFTPEARSKGLELALDVAPDMPAWFAGDTVRVRQVLFNLVGNALKFTDAGGVRVRAALERGDGGPRLVFTVEDTGIGIEPERIPDLFRPFIQADASHSRKHQGAGLGLAIVKGLVERMGGRIDLTSALGRGTTVRVALPYREASPSQGRHDEADRAWETLQTPPLRILLAEDERIIRLATSRQLERWGHGVACADNGLQALELLERAEFDCVLLDIQMPLMDGYETAARIRALESGARNRDVPVVALTAHAMKGYREQVLAAGMDDYLSKPIDLSRLRVALAKASRGRRAFLPGEAVRQGHGA